MKLPETGDFTRLFSPIQVGPMTIANRICETTNTIGAGRSDGLPDEPFTEHHLAKARGGTAWIGNETWVLNSPIPPDAPDEFLPGSVATRFPLYALPNFVPRMSKFTDAIHDEGAVVVCQLTHLNAMTAPSSVPGVEAYDWIPHALDDAEIATIIATYSAAARQMQAGGADGVEIHCAHETLPHLFLSPATNHRTDEWGGSPEARVRFVIAILQSVREAIGDSMALGVRIGAEERRDGGYSLLEMREMATLIADTGLLDFVNVDVGHSWGIPSYVQPSFYGHADYRDAGRAIRADVAPVPTIFSGRVNDPVLAEELLAEGICDLVGMTRAGIADPDFPTKAREGRLDEIRRCIGCNRCIGEAVHSHAPLPMRKAICSVNPVVGNELAWKSLFRPASAPGHVVVVGAGAAGLEAARVSAMRGHRVTLLESAPQIGGQVRLAARTPGRDAFEDLINFHSHQIELLGIDLCLGSAIDASGIVDMEPTSVICATGSQPLSSEVPGADSDHVHQAWDVLAGNITLGQGSRVALISQEDHMEAASAALYLAQVGCAVEIFHKWTGICSEVDRYTIGVVMRLLEEAGVAIHTGVRLSGVTSAAFELKSAFTGRRQIVEGFDALVLAYGSAPDTRIYEELKEIGAGRWRNDSKPPKLFLAGAAWLPRGIAEATQHGMKAALDA